MIKYKINLNGHRFMPAARIAPVEVERETKTSVWISGDRKNKRSRWENYYDTWEEAHAALKSQAESVVDNVRVQLANANGKMGNIKGMKEPGKEKEG